MRSRCAAGPVAACGVRRWSATAQRRCGAFRPESSPVLAHLVNSFKRPDRHTLTAEEVQRVVACVPGTPTVKRGLAKSLGAGDVPSKDVLSALCDVAESTLSEAEWRDVFELVDANNNGLLEVEELVALLSTSRSRISREEALAMIRAVDANDDGMLDFDEFIRLVQTHSVVACKFLSSYRCGMVVGGPSSGKGTICGMLKQHVDVAHISCGDLLRDEVQSGSQLGREVEEVMRSGGLVDASVVIALLDKRLGLSPRRLLLLDGFPRSEANALDFLENFGEPTAILNFICPEDVMLRRIVERGRTSGRADDNAETARRRIDTFKQQSEGPLRVFRERGTAVYDVDTMRAPEENVEMLLQLPLFKGLRQARPEA